MESVSLVNSNPIFIFTGPTLSPQRAKQHLDAICLPPVKLGDVYRITELFAPRVIGIIDGYFNQVPAVWHKEILWAISRGVQVYGAASMGALRAAELDTLGMCGCGEIYQAYASGVLAPFEDEPFEDDDEVAVIHSPPELGYLAASEAMVNIRFSLAEAMREGIIDRQSGIKLVRIAKELFYAERSYPTILKIAIMQGLPEEQMQRLEKWLKHASVNQKQRDAIALLKEIKHSSQPQTDTGSSEQSPFIHTSQWQSAIDEIDRSHITLNRALNELRLQGERYFQTLERAACGAASPVLDQPGSIFEDLQGLHTSPEKLNQLLSECWQRNNTTPSGDQRILAYIEQSGELESLQARAIDKQERLARKNHKPHSAALNELQKLQLGDWYFSQQLSTDMPRQLDKYVAELGLDDISAFYDMILGEYLYLKPET